MVCKQCNKQIPDNAVYCHICDKKQSVQTAKYRQRPHGQGTIPKLTGHRAASYWARLPTDYSSGTAVRNSVGVGQLVLLPKADTIATKPFTDKDLHILWNVADKDNRDLLSPQKSAVSSGWIIGIPDISTYSWNLSSLTALFPIPAATHTQIFRNAEILRRKS